jgi:H+/Cl- antiporter ClcA
MDPRNTRSFPLWFGLLGPPAAWGAHLVLGDLIYEVGCAPGMSRHAILGQSLDFWALLMTAVLAAVTALAGVLAFRAWRQLRQQHDGTSLGRASAMAIAGIASSLLYLLIILFALLPSLFLRVCSPSP